MGTKFANIHIPNLDSKILDNDIIKEYTYIKSPDGYYVIMDADFNIGTIIHVGKELSKQLKTSLMTVGYYDDDVLELTIFDKGKRITQYTSDDCIGLSKKKGSANLFCKYLGCDEKHSSLFKAIQSCEDLSKQAYLLKALIGAPIWSGYNMIGEYENHIFVREYDIPAVEDYVKEAEREKRAKAATRKIKNRCRLELLYEVEAMERAFYSNGSDVFFVLGLVNDDGKFPSGNNKLYVMGDDGGLKESDLDMGETLRYNLKFHIFQNNKYLGVVDDRRINAYRAVVLNADDNTIVSTYKSPEGLYPSFLGNQGSIVFTDNHNIYLYNNQGIAEWSRPVPRNRFVVMHENHIYATGYSNENELIIFKINMDGEILQSYSMDDVDDLHGVFVDNENHVYLITKYELHKLNSDFEFMDSIVVPDWITSYKFNRNNNMLYLATHGNIVHAVDVSGMEVIYCQKNPCGYGLYLWHYTSNNDILCVPSDNILEVRDPSMQLISRHKVKGGITEYAYKNNRGNACIVTTTFSNWYAGKGKYYFRIYELLY